MWFHLWFLVSACAVVSRQFLISARLISAVISVMSVNGMWDFSHVRPFISETQSSSLELKLIYKCSQICFLILSRHIYWFLLWLLWFQQMAYKISSFGIYPGGGVTVILTGGPINYWLNFYFHLYHIKHQWLSNSFVMEPNSTCWVWKMVQMKLTVWQFGPASQLYFLNLRWDRERKIFPLPFVFFLSLLLLTKKGGLARGLTLGDWSKYTDFIVCIYGWRLQLYIE